MRHLDVFLHKEVTTLIDAFAVCFSVKVTIFSKEMEELAVGLQNPGSQYCRYIQKELGLLHSCKMSDRNMCHHVANSRSSMTYRCHAGLLESIIPIVIDGTIIGSLIIGQFRDSKESPNTFAFLKGENDIFKENLFKAYSSLPCFEPEMLENMLRLADMLVQYITSRNLVSIRQGILIERIQRYIEENIGSAISLVKASKSLKRSCSSISHVVKKELGMSFLHLVNLRKVERFEMLLVRDPSISIRDVASQLGYQDQFYFSRLYKKLRGVTPSSFVKSLRKGLRSKTQ